MNKVKKIVATILLAGTLASVSIAVAACSDKNTSKSSIEFNPDSFVMEVMSVKQGLFPVVTGLDEYVLVWESSNKEVVTVDESGVLYSGEILGTSVITAKIENTDLSDTYTVTVDNTSDAVPTISVDNIDGNVVNLYCGDSFELDVSCLFNSNELMSPWKLSTSDESIVAVQNNVLQAKKSGLAIITISANCVGKEIAKNITVNVIDNIQVSYDNTEIDLTFGSKETMNLSLLSLRVNDEFKPVDISKVSYKIIDDSVVSLTQNGSVATVTAQGAGKTSLICTYSYEGKEYQNTIPVNVSRKKVKISGNYIVDLSQSEVKLPSELTSQLDMQKIKNVKYGKTDIVFDGDVITNKLETGVQVWNFIDDKIEYTVDVCIATKVLYSANDVINMQKYGGIDENDATKNYNYSGYFVLGCDIDLSSIVLNPLFTTQNGGVNAGQGKNYTAGFQGVLDGCGYTIYNGIFGQGGLFGTMSSFATVKNIAFIGGKIKGSFSTLFAKNCFGVFDNVYAEVESNTPKDTTSVFFGYHSGANRVKNCIFRVTNAQESGMRMLGFWISNRCESENVYVICDVQSSSIETNAVKVSGNQALMDAVLYSHADLINKGYADNPGYFSGFTAKDGWVIDGDFPVKRKLQISGHTGMRLGETQTLSVAGNFDDYDKGTWKSDSANLSVDNSGRVTALSEGNGHIIYIVDGKQHRFTIDIIGKDVAVPLTLESGAQYINTTDARSISIVTSGTENLLELKLGAAWLFRFNFTNVTELSQDKVYGVKFYINIDKCGYTYDKIQLFYITSGLDDRVTVIEDLQEGENEVFISTALFNQLIRGEKKLVLVDFQDNFSAKPLKVQLSNVITVNFPDEVQISGHTGMRLGETQTLSITGNFDGYDKGTWSSDSANLSVDNSGRVTALSEGNGHIIYIVDGKQHRFTIDIIGKDVAVPLTLESGAQYINTTDARSISIVTSGTENLLELKLGAAWLFRFSFTNVAELSEETVSCVKFYINIDKCGYTYDKIQLFYFTSSIDDRVAIVNELHEGKNSVTLPVALFNQLIRGEKKLALVDFQNNFTGKPLKIQLSDVMIVNNPTFGIQGVRPKDRVSLQFDEQYCYGNEDYSFKLDPGEWDMQFTLTGNYTKGVSFYVYADTASATELWCDANKTRILVLQPKTWTKVQLTKEQVDAIVSGTKKLQIRDNNNISAIDFYVSNIVEE